MGKPNPKPTAQIKTVLPPSSLPTLNRCTLVSLWNSCHCGAAASTSPILNYVHHSSAAWYTQVPVQLPQWNPSVMSSHFCPNSAILQLFTVLMDSLLSFCLWPWAGLTGRGKSGGELATREQWPVSMSFMQRKNKQQNQCKNSRTWACKATPYRSLWWHLWEGNETVWWIFEERIKRKKTACGRGRKIFQQRKQASFSHFREKLSRKRIQHTKMKSAFWYNSTSGIPLVNETSS